MFGRQQESHIPNAVKPLNSEFESLGEAIYHWVNSNGYGPNKRLDSECVASFCRSLGIPVVGFSTGHLRSHKQFFPETKWLTDFIAAQGFQRVGIADYVKVDDHNRPIAFLSVQRSTRSNLDLDYAGMESIAHLLRAEVEKNIVFDETLEIEPDFITIENIDEDGEVRYNRSSVKRERSTEPAYYPYLEGGVTELLRQFMESDETVLVLLGPPGTGKSSAIISAITELNLLPMYATKPEVVLHKKFASKMFQLADSHMARLGDSRDAQRKAMFKESDLLDTEMMLNKDLHNEDEIAAKIPVLVVEDADLLLAPRKSGNQLMAQLLNETDGVNSNTIRKVIFTTNLTNQEDIEPALIRPGRCFDVIHFRLLSPAEAIAARAISGLPEFEETPTKDVSLAEVLRKPRKKLVLDKGRVGMGFIK